MRGRTFLDWWVGNSRRIRGVGILLILAVVFSPSPGVATDCESCPEVGTLQCISLEICEGKEGGCNPPGVPPECLSCPYEFHCTEWECSGDHSGLQRLECRLERVE